MSKVNCYNCGESVSSDGNVCILCGADKEISIDLAGAKITRNIFAFAVAFGVGYFVGPGWGLVWGGLALYASSNYFLDELKKKYPGKKIRMW